MMNTNPATLTDVLRCPACLSALRAERAKEKLNCTRCAHTYPIINQIPRMLLPSMHSLLNERVDSAGMDAQQVATAHSFGFEWEHFSEMYEEWEFNFLGYMGPHDKSFFRGKRVLDAGCGSGRHAYYASLYGA